jgi:hypothetical protein
MTSEPVWRRSLDHVTTRVTGPVGVGGKDLDRVDRRLFGDSNPPWRCDVARRHQWRCVNAA